MDRRPQSQRKRRRTEYLSYADNGQQTTAPASGGNEEKDHDDEAGEGKLSNDDEENETFEGDGADHDGDDDDDDDDDDDFEDEDFGPKRKRGRSNKKVRIGRPPRKVRRRRDWSGGGREFTLPGHNTTQRNIREQFQKFYDDHDRKVVIRAADVGLDPVLTFSTFTSDLANEMAEARENKKTTPRRRRPRNADGQHPSIRRARPSIHAARDDETVWTLQRGPERHHTGKNDSRWKAGIRDSSALFRSDLGPANPYDAEWLSLQLEDRFAGMLLAQAIEGTNTCRRRAFEVKNATQSALDMASWNIAGGTFGTVVIYGNHAQRYNRERGPSTHGDRGMMIGTLARVPQVPDTLELCMSEDNSSSMTRYGHAWNEVARRDGRTSRGHRFHHLVGICDRDIESSKILLEAALAQLFDFRLPHALLAEPTPRAWLGDVTLGVPQPHRRPSTTTFLTEDEIDVLGEKVDFTLAEEDALKEAERDGSNKAGRYIAAHKKRREYLAAVPCECPTRRYLDGRVLFSYARVEAPNMRWPRDGSRGVVRKGTMVEFWGVIRMDVAQGCIVAGSSRPTLADVIVAMTDSIPPNANFELYAVALLDLDATTPIYLSVRLESAAIGSMGVQEEFPVTFIPPLPSNGDAESSVARRRLLSMTVDVDCVLVLRTQAVGPVFAAIPVVVGPRFLDPSTRRLRLDGLRPAAAGAGVFHVNVDGTAGTRAEDEIMTAVRNVVTIASAAVRAVGRLIPIEVKDIAAGHKHRSSVGEQPCIRARLSILAADPLDLLAAVYAVPGKGSRGDPANLLTVVTHPHELTSMFYDKATTLIYQDGAAYGFDVDEMSVTREWVGPGTDFLFDKLPARLPAGLLCYGAAAHRYLAGAKMMREEAFPCPDSHRKAAPPGLAAGSDAQDGLSIEVALVGPTDDTIRIESAAPGTTAFTTYLEFGGPSDDGVDPPVNRVRFYVLQSVDLRLLRFNRDGAEVFRVTKHLHFEPIGGFWLGGDSDIFGEMGRVSVEAEAISWPSTSGVTRPAGAPPSYADVLYKIDGIPDHPRPCWPNRSLGRDLRSHGYPLSTFGPSEGRAVRITTRDSAIISLHPSDGRPPVAVPAAPTAYDWDQQPPKVLSRWTDKVIRKIETKLRRDAVEAGVVDDIGDLAITQGVTAGGPGVEVVRLQGPTQVTVVAAEDCVIAVTKDAEDPSVTPVTRLLYVDGLLGRLLDADVGVHVTFSGVDTWDPLKTIFGDSRCRPMNFIGTEDPFRLVVDDEFLFHRHPTSNSAVPLAMLVEGVHRTTTDATFLAVDVQVHTDVACWTVGLRRDDPSTSDEATRVLFKCSGAGRIIFFLKIAVGAVVVTTHADVDDDNTCRTHVVTPPPGFGAAPRHGAATVPAAPAATSVCGRDEWLRSNTVRVWGPRASAEAVALCHAGSGVVKVNGRPIDCIASQKLGMREPIVLVGRDAFKTLDMNIQCDGGSFSEQVRAVQQCIARGLLAWHRQRGDHVVAAQFQETFKQNFDASLLMYGPSQS